MSDERNSEKTGKAIGSYQRDPFDDPAIDAAKTAFESRLARALIQNRPETQLFMV